MHWAMPSVDSDEYAFAGVISGNECFCGDAHANYSRLGTKSDSDCLFVCSGKEYESCGGVGSIAVFNGKQSCTSLSNGIT